MVSGGKPRQNIAKPAARMLGSTNILIPRAEAVKTPFHVAVEGNIGAGKSSVLSLLESFEDLEINPEPIDTWRNFQGHNLLQLMYQHPEKHTFAFQTAVQLSRCVELARNSAKEVRIFERTLDSSRFVFSEFAYNERNLSDHELAIIQAWYTQLKQNLPPIGLYIYLRSSPEVVLNRIKTRGREEEANIDIEFLTKLHRLHEEWLMNERHGPLGAKLLVINADQTQEKIKKQLLENMNLIKGL